MLTPGVSRFMRRIQIVGCIRLLFAQSSLISLLARPALAPWVGLKIEIEVGHTLCAALGGLASGLMGAIYPALRAAGQDAVEALNYK
jgi:ABC-type lipoprotein release transport system permease subunit